MKLWHGSSKVLRFKTKNRKSSNSKLKMLSLSLIFSRRTINLPIHHSHKVQTTRKFPRPPDDFIYDSLARYPYAMREWPELYFGIIKGKGKRFLVMIDLRHKSLDDKFRLITGYDYPIIKFDFLKSKLIFLSRHRLFVILLDEVLKTPLLSLPIKSLSSICIDDFTIRDMTRKRDMIYVRSGLKYMIFQVKFFYYLNSLPFLGEMRVITRKEAMQLQRKHLVNSI